MQESNADQLKRVIESQHGGSATYFQSVRLLDAQNPQALWDGIVHVFNLKDHPKAKRAYAWSSTIKGSGKDRFFAVLHMGRINGPGAAVKAAATAIHKWGAGPAKGAAKSNPKK
jgi:hypothetical protein